MNVLKAPSIERMSYSIRDAAQCLGISDRSIWQLIKDGRLRSIRLGRKHLIARTVIEAFLAGEITSH